ncbi:MAG: hypothetical protein ABSG42_03865 [Nitrospirota bacterium]
MNRGGFSWKRALGVSAAKARLSRQIGIPLTKSGRQRKLGKIITGGGCLLNFCIGMVLLIIFSLTIFLSSTAFAGRHKNKTVKDEDHYYGSKKNLSSYHPKSPKTKKISTTEDKDTVKQ